MDAKKIKTGVHDVDDNKWGSASNTLITTAIHRPFPILAADRRVQKGRGHENDGDEEQENNEDELIFCCLLLLHLFFTSLLANHRLSLSLFDERIIIILLYIS
jgi:hypothetical protein